MQSLLSSWSFRNLSLIGKVTVIKSLAFPIIIQVLTVLPSPSIQILKKIQNTFFNFLWNSKVDKIKRDIMIRDLDEGGLRVPDIFTYCKSLKLTWIKRAMDPANQSDWKKLLLDNIEFVGGDKFWHLTKTGLNQITERTNFGKFWYEVVEIWGNLQEPFTTAPESILSQPLWFNSSIKIDGHPIFYQNWCNQDIFFINDLIDETGIFMNYHVFTRKYYLNISYISYAGILSSIPRDWKRIIKDYGKRVDAITNKNIDQITTLEKPSKSFYKKIISKKPFCNNKSHLKWQNDLHSEIDATRWKHIHSLPFKETKDSKLQTLQFRIIHRIFFTNTMLMKRQLLEHERCTFCNSARETVLHLFWDCTHSQTIWTCFLNVIREKYNITIARNPEYFLLGTYQNDQIPGLGILILLIKKYISLMRQYQKIPNWDSCKIFMINYKNIDLYSLYLHHPSLATNIRQKWNSINLILN